VVKTAAKLPKGIGHDLKFLEILDVRGGLISELPPSVGELIDLRCLWADRDTVMKGEIGKLTCLEELKLYSVDKCPNFFTEVGKLKKLRALKIYFDEIEQLNGKVLTESLNNLHKIQSLKVSFHDCDDKDSTVRGGSLEDMASSKKLYSFIISGIIIQRVPSWINYLCVPLLSELFLIVTAVEVRDIQNIGSLPSLLHLVLWSNDEKYISYTFDSNEFQKLRFLSTKKVEITIEEGALPMLEILGYSASTQRKDATTLVPWNKRCPLLKVVTCWLDCANCGYRKVKGAKEVLRRAASYQSIDLCINMYEVADDWLAGYCLFHLQATNSGATDSEENDDKDYYYDDDNVDNDRTDQLQEYNDAATCSSRDHQAEEASKP